jgi:hypothetical protein
VFRLSGAICMPPGDFLPWLKLFYVYVVNVSVFKEGARNFTGSFFILCREGEVLLLELVFRPQPLPL